MGISKEKLKSGILEYANKEFTPKLSGLRVWAFPVMVGALVERLCELYDNNKETLRLMGYIDEDGNIDIDAIYNAFIMVAREKGNVTENILLLGAVSFTPNDIDMLYNILRS